MSSGVAQRKCVVWDLDNTVWDGVLLEDERVALRPGVRETVAALDERGILHSVASRNDPGAALAKLAEFGLADYFLHPQIGWGAKSASVRAVAAAIGIGTDALVFVDDDPFERDEVAAAEPAVLCLGADQVPDLVRRPELSPAVVTEEARSRRSMYRAAQQREAAEESFAGPAEEFLATLDMRLRIERARPQDLARAQELTVRTHQLNATGKTYSYEELDAFRASDGHELLIAELTDRYGPYGKIGVVLLETASDAWTIKLLLMSCRVLSRGVGAIIVNHLRRRAHDAAVPLYAQFVHTGRNRMMYVAYRLGGFSEAGKDADVVLLRADPGDIPRLPAYVQLTAEI